MERIPIVGQLADGSMSSDFKKRKLALKELGYPVKQTQELVDEMFERSREKFLAVIDKSSVLVVMPSGSGVNKIPILFAHKLQEITGCKILPETLVVKRHRAESKHSLALEERVKDPISFKLDADAKQYFSRDQKVFIVDDVIATGENSVRLAKVLKSHGIPVNGLINLVTIESRYPTQGDLDRLAKKFDNHMRLDQMERNSLKNDIALVFEEYTRQRINRLERPVKDEATAARAKEAVKKMAVIERNFDKSLLQNQQLSL